MKKIMAGALLTVACTQLHAQQTFSITGKLTEVKDAKIMLDYREGKKRLADSVVIKDGLFSFKGTITEPQKASITVKPLNDDGVMSLEKYINRDTREFYIEPGHITISGATAKTAAIQGGPTQADHNLLQEQLAPLQKQMKPHSAEITKAMQAKDEAAVKVISKKMAPIREQMTATEENFIKAHPASYVSWDLVKHRSVMINPSTFEPLFAAVDQKFHDSEDGKNIAGKLAITKKTAIGLQVMDFTQNDTKGKPVSLSSLKGKYVLLDFWASWCGPCRAENPNVLKAYNKFKEKNFEVMAVSLDDKKDKWLEAIEKDGMPWIHVSDLKGFENVVAKQFAIQAIPQNLLIDPNGVIIAKNLRGESLDKELEKFIK